MIDDFNKVPWHISSIFDDVNDVLWCWETLYKNTLSIHLKSRKVKIRQQSQPWMNTEIRKQLNIRYKMLNNIQAKSIPKTSMEWKQYKKQRNKCTRLTRTAKSNYWKNKFDSSTNVKTFWKTVAEFQGKRKRSTIGPLKNTIGETIYTDKEKANLINNHFATIAVNLRRQTIAQVNQNDHIYRVTPSCDKIDISYENYKKSFKKCVKPGKACGDDGIQSTFLHKIGPKDCGLYEVVKNVIESKRIPKKWRLAKVSCQFKKGSPLDCDNYRPISLLSIPSKITESMVCTNFDNHLERNHLISEHQWGFRNGRSTETLLLYMTEKWKRAMDENKVVAVLFIDFKKAFDCVDHDILKKKLIACGISGDLYQFMSDYLSKREQFTIVNGTKSDTQQVKHGVPQGSLFGPRMFTAEVNDLPKSITTGEIELFADDTTPYVISASFSEAFANMSKIIQQVNYWTEKNLLTIHPKKTKIMFMSRKPFIGPMPLFTLKDESIDIVDHSKCLGIDIDKNLSWTNHSKSILKRYKTKFKQLYNLRSCQGSQLKSIYFQGILPSIIYCISIWGSSNHNILQKLNDVHIKAARFTCKIKKKVPDKEVLSSCGWQSINHYYKRRIAYIAFDIYNQCTPEPIQSLLSKYNTTRNTRNKMNFVVPKFNSNLFKNSFTFKAVHLWNNLPIKIKEMNRVNFRNELKQNPNLVNKIIVSSVFCGKATDIDQFYYH